MERYIDANRKAYDFLATQYQTRLHNKSDFEESPDVLGRFALKNVLREDFKRAIKVAEFGPGNGCLLSFFERNGCRTVGVELSAEMAKLCKLNSPESIIINNNVLDVNFMIAQFDLIYMGAVIHLFPKTDAESLLKKAYNWLNENGILFINTTCNFESIESYSSKVDYKDSPVRFRKTWTEEELIECVSRQGFCVIEKMYTDESDRNKQWVALSCKKACFI